MNIAPLNDERGGNVVVGMRVAAQKAVPDAPPMRTVLDLIAAGRFGAAEIFVERNRHRLDAATRSEWIAALLSRRSALASDEDAGPIDRLGEAIIRCRWETP